MSKKIWPFIAKTRVTVLLSSVFCAFTMFAQLSLSEKLSEVLTTKDMDKGFLLYNQITDSEIKQLSDSVLFDYHYLGAFFNSDNYTETPNHDKALYHLKEAKRLCDTSLGTYFVGYMEVMNGLGDEYLEQGNFEEALAIYEEGLIKSMAIRESHPQFFAYLIMGIQECYENLGLFSEVPNHLMDAWGFWDKDIEPLQSYSYFPLWSLEQFYYKYEYFEDALKINDEILKFINEKGGNNNPEMAEALYFRGNLLTNMNKYEEAIATYRQALSILDSDRLAYEETYGHILGNLLMASIPNEDFNTISDILSSIKSYGHRIDDKNQYADALFSASKEYSNHGNYDLALALNSELLGLELEENIRAFILDQREQFEYSKRVVESLNDLEITYSGLQPGSNDWFETAFELSSAYFRKKDTKKNRSILQSIYDAVVTNESAKEEFYLAVVDGLFNIYFELEDYANALKYSKEKWLYVSEIPEIPEKYKYTTLNGVIVACLRANNLRDIDDYMEQAEPLCLKLFTYDSEEYSIFLHNRGRAYQLQGNLNEAKRNYLLSNTLHIKNVGKANPRTVQYLAEVEEQLVDEGLDL